MEVCVTAGGPHPAAQVISQALLEISTFPVLTLPSPLSLPKPSLSLSPCSLVSYFPLPLASQHSGRHFASIASPPPPPPPPLLLVFPLPTRHPPPRRFDFFFLFVHPAGRGELALSFLPSFFLDSISALVVRSGGGGRKNRSRRSWWLGKSKVAGWGRGRGRRRSATLTASGGASSVCFSPCNLWSGW